jgi:hypothetical protein
MLPEYWRQNLCLGCLIVLRTAHMEQTPVEARLQSHRANVDAAALTPLVRAMLGDSEVVSHTPGDLMHVFLEGASVAIRAMQPALFGVTQGEG